MQGPSWTLSSADLAAVWPFLCLEGIGRARLSTLLSRSEQCG